MFEYRVTKYDPELRDEHGAFLRDEWTSVSDIGRVFEGVVLTREAYQRVEDAYVATARAFLEEANCHSLRVVDLEHPDDAEGVPEEGHVLEGRRLSEAIRRVLREEYWCRLEGHGCFLHFGYDYYMYVGVPRVCEAAQRLARSEGLFVELQVSRVGAED